MSRRRSTIRRLEIPDEVHVRSMIGRNGERIKSIRSQTETSITVEYQPNCVVISGDIENVEEAVRIYNNILYNPLVIEISELDDSSFRSLVGTRYSILQDIRDSSSAYINIDKEQRKIYITGDETQKEKAENTFKENIKNVLDECTGDTNPREDETFHDYVPEDCIGLVIGKEGANTKQIENQTGVNVRFKDYRMIFRGGTREDNIRAGVLVKRKVAYYRNNKAKLCGTRNCVSFSKLDDIYLKLKPVTQLCAEMEGDLYYRCVIADQDDSDSHEIVASTHQGLCDVLLEGLQKLEQLREKAGIQIDIWAHFGQMHIHNIGEETADEDLFQIKDIEDKVNTRGSNSWSTRFMEGISVVDCEEIKEAIYDENDENVDIIYVNRFDMSFFSPRAHEIRFKAWVHTDDKNRHRFVPCPEHKKLKNFLCEVHQLNPDTEESLIGYICLPSVKEIEANLLQPECKYDCRILVRANKMSLRKDDERILDEEELRKIKSYLSQAAIDENGEVSLSENFPEGFEMHFSRFSRRMICQYLHTDKKKYIIETCRETKTTSDGVKTTRKEPQVDIHLHLDEWNQMFLSGKWEAQAVVDKLPDFMQFVKDMQEVGKW